MFHFDENQGFWGFFDEGQELGMFAHTICKKLGRYGFLPYLCIVNKTKG